MTIIETFWNVSRVAVVLVRGVSEHRIAFSFWVKQLNCCENFTRIFLLKLYDLANEDAKIFRNVWDYNPNHIKKHQITLEYSVFL
jgi:hypothetical protein